MPVSSDRCSVMNSKTLPELIISVIFSKEVLAVTIMIAVYLNLVFYVLHYRKRPAGLKKKRAAAAPAPAKDAEPEVEEDE